MADPALIHAKFEAQAAQRPKALALSSEDGALSYGQLERLSRRLAERIAQSGTGRRDVVAILAERGPKVVVAALACARAGRPFLILDLAYPTARLLALIEICRPRLLLLASREGDGADWGPPAIAVDLEAPDLPEPAGLTSDISPDDPAYLLFTSGSTGTPKCVACSHRPLVNFVGWQARTFDLSPGDRFTMLSGLSHDPILRDIFTPLSLGASIHIPSQATLTTPGALFDWAVRIGPTVAHMTPPLGRLLTAVRGRRERLEALRYAFWGGDVLRRSAIAALADLAPACESVNFYGSTETPQAASCFRVPSGFADERAPIGTGVDGFALEIQGEQGRALPNGEAGEIVVRSDLLTLGYVVDGRLPAAGEGAGVYATGDLGYRRADGQLVIQGRRDDQVKVRGYRVELAEITAGALRSPKVGQAVTLNVGADDEVRLCCFVEPARGRLDPKALRAEMAEVLPAYMVPDEVAALAKLPLLPNGKIDRQALIASRASQPAGAPPQSADLTRAEAALVASWRDFFRRAEITPASSFAALGGDSLSYVSAYLSVEEALGRVPDNWTTMTIAQLAAVAEPPTARKSRFVEIESAIALRAAAISLVVASHFGLIFSGGGATSALLWVSGAIFGGLQLREMDHAGSLKPIGRLLKSILLPLYLIEAPQFLVKLATHHHPQLSSLFLYTDLIDYRGMPVSGPDAYLGHEYFLWYIHAVVHIVLAYAALGSKRD